MEGTAKLPGSGLIAYFGPRLTDETRLRLAEAGYTVEALPADAPDAELPAGAAGFVFGLGIEHPMRAALQREAVRRNLPVLADLALLGHLSTRLRPDEERRVLVTGSAGKSVTAALIQRLLAEGGLEARRVSAEDGYLNALGITPEVLLVRVEPSAVRYAEGLSPAVGVVLNLTEEDGAPVGDKARGACARLLTGVRFGVLGADDTGAQALLMAVRRRSTSSARSIVPISGGATLSDGYFAIDRCVYAIRNGRTRRVAGFTETAALLGDHFGQDAAAAAAVAGFFGVNDDDIADGLRGFRGLEGRFDCIGTEGRIVFVDDRFARTRASTEAAVAACPELFWIGHRLGDIARRTRSAMRGAFFLVAPDDQDPPIDGVVTFRDADDATAAALRAAEELIRREPQAAPVILFSPGAPGFHRQGELFRLKALSYLSERGRAHG